MLKKVVLILLFISVITTACSKKLESKNYNSVDEYEQAMKIVQAKYHAFKFTTDKYIIKNKGQKKEFQMISFSKGYKLRDDSKAYKLVFSGDTVRVNNKPAPIVPKEWMTAYILTNWNSAETIKGIKSKTFTSRNAEVNGIPCRMIKYNYLNGNNVEVCINDKYGVAVYYHFIGHQNINGYSDKNLYEENIKVSKIETNDLSDSIFK